MVAAVWRDVTSCLNIREEAFGQRPEADQKDECGDRSGGERGERWQQRRDGECTPDDRKQGQCLALLLRVRQSPTDEAPA